MNNYKFATLFFGVLSVSCALCFALMLLLAQLGVFTPDKNEVSELVIVASSMEKEYDGTPLSSPDYTLQKGKLLNGHTLDVSVFGEQLTAGSCENQLSARVLDEYGRDVTRVYYKLHLVSGVLTVHKRTLAVYSANAEKIYDGKELTRDTAGCSNEERLLDGHELDLEVVGSACSVGYAPNTVIATVFDEKGQEVTENYDFEYTFGKLQVLPRPIRVTVSSAEKIYDGTPLSSEEYTVDADLLSGHRFFARIDVQITNPGEIANTLSFYKIEDEQGRDVTHCYAVSVTEGLLMVFPDVKNQEGKNALS